MNLVGLRCRCEGDLTKVYPPDHYTTTDAATRCKHPPMPIPWIRSLLNGQTSHKSRINERSSITSGLGCTRQGVIGANLPIVGDLTKLDSVTKGRTIHAELEKWGAPDYTELKFPSEGQPPPVVCGVPMVGVLDFVTRDYQEIAEYKLHSEFAQKNKIKSRPQFSNDDAQLNIQRLLVAKAILHLEDLEEYKPKLIIWHGAQTSSKGPPGWYPLEGKYMTEEEILSYHPLGGDLTVQQLFQTLTKFREDVAGGVPIPEAIHRMPLAGRSMIGGLACTEYCFVKEVCDGLEGVRPANEVV